MASAPARQLNSKVCSLIFNLAVHVFSFMGNRAVPATECAQYQCAMLIKMA